MRIAIIGATGGTGRHFIDLASARNHALTALARTPAKLDAVRDKVTVVRADGRDVDSLTAALEPEFDAVVSIVGASGLFEARKVTDLYSVTTANLIVALTRRRLSRLVVVSSAGVEPQVNDGWFYVHVLKRYFLGPMYADILRIAGALKASALDYTIVRPPYLTGGGPTGKYRISVGRNFDDDKSLRRGHLAEFLLRSVEQPNGFLRQTVALSE